MKQIHLIIKLMIVLSFGIFLENTDQKVLLQNDKIKENEKVANAESGRFFVC
ncbi:hypothetical protein [Thermoactinomyces sp. DSM 45892]|uniref:hypothetical protein n=1 Tax=Thermoactinomyces sp. DSM 45892 TaxID=1882753 RepID=UPI00089C231A|nr:hypothetical protein [Thermoactinomyces sp. DSM 45892]SDY60101.1 hypothetical protein SAMN05444416_10690 [Thermoactinomyces sp. DSM 45892]